MIRNLQEQVELGASPAESLLISRYAKFAVHDRSRQVR